ncbi:hypothetical protein COTS27_00823 [Spirochaetota bacterium]|nr:hypothetical protein COTS27_00823 [Spirochaetota bacterium]
MKITRRCDYALRTLIYIAYREDLRQYKITTKELAGQLSIPFKVLSMVLVQLKHGKLIRSSRGAQGGYFLDKSPNDITLYEVILLIDGAVSNYRHDFSASPTNDSVNAVQSIQSALEQVQNRTLDTMRKITLRELVTSYHKLTQEDRSYSI